MSVKNNDKKATELDKEIRKKMDQREAENRALKKILEQLNSKVRK